MNNAEKNTYVKEHITASLIDYLKSGKIDDISISELCDRAGVGRASFYRNYDSKEDVIRQYSNQLIIEWGKQFEGDPNSSFFNVFGSLFHHYKEYSDFYTILIRQNMSYLILDTIKFKINLSKDDPNIDAYGKAFFAYGLYGWICEWIDRGMQETPDEINELFKQNQQPNK